MHGIDFLHAERCGVAHNCVYRIFMQPHRTRMLKVSMVNSNYTNNDDFQWWLMRPRMVQRLRKCTEWWLRVSILGNLNELRHVFDEAFMSSTSSKGNVHQPSVTIKARQMDRTNAESHWIWKRKTWNKNRRGNRIAHGLSKQCYFHRCLYAQCRPISTGIESP